MVIVWVIVCIAAIAVVSGMVSALAGQRRSGGREWRRTCNRCQTVWYVSRADAREHAPTRGDMVAAKMYRAGKRGSLLTTRAAAAEMEVHNLEAKAARVSGRDSCPGCGSQSFAATLV